MVISNGVHVYCLVWTVIFRGTVNKDHKLGTNTAIITTVVCFWEGSVWLDSVNIMFTNFQNFVEEEDEFVKLTSFHGHSLLRAVRSSLRITKWGHAKIWLLMLPWHCSSPGLAEHSAQSAGDVGHPHCHDRDVVQLHSGDPGSPNAAADRRAGARPLLPAVQQAVLLSPPPHLLLDGQEAAAWIHSPHSLPLLPSLPSGAGRHGGGCGAVCPPPALVHLARLLHRLPSPPAFLARGGGGVGQRVCGHGVLSTVGPHAGSVAQEGLCFGQSG